MSAPTERDVNPFLQSKAAVALLTELRRSTDGRTGDRLSVTIHAVTNSRDTLSSAEVEAGIAAIALLLADYDPDLLTGADDEQALRDWLREVDTELTPGRGIAVSAALARIELGLDNEWYRAHKEAGTLTEALHSLHRLRDDLTDAS
jgi:hypothetical protein